MKIMLILLSFIFFISCGNNSIDNKNNENQEKRIKYTGNEDIINVKHLNDTLTVVSTDQILYFPFGKINSKQRLTEVFNQFQIIEEKEREIRLSFKSSKLKFVFDDEQGLFHIVSGTINDNEIAFSNDIKIDYTKKSVLSKYLQENEINENDFNVLILESGLTGIWHYYEFENNKLKRIKFDTDYILEK